MITTIIMIDFLCVNNIIQKSNKFIFSKKKLKNFDESEAVIKNIEENC